MNDAPAERESWWDALGRRKVVQWTVAYADMSPAKDQEYMSDGIAEELLRRNASASGKRRDHRGGGSRG